MADRPSVLRVTRSAPPQPESKCKKHGTPSTQLEVPDSQHLIIHQHHLGVTTITLHVNPFFREDLTTPPSQPLPPSKRPRTRYLRQDTNLPTAIPVLLPESSSGQERAKLAANLVRHKRKKAQATQPITAVTSIYKHELNYKVIDRHKLFKPHRRVGSNSSPQTYQKQYHTHWAPKTIEKWAIPILTAADFKKASVTATKRSDIHCACGICSDWKGKKSLTEPFEDMHVCDVFNRTYHWSCLLRLCCYKDGDRESVKKYETWACPACACLTDSEKESRHHFAEIEELKVVTETPPENQRK